MKGSGSGIDLLLPDLYLLILNYYLIYFIIVKIKSIFLCCLTAGVYKNI